MDMTFYYSQLVGFKITGFRMEEDEFGGDPFPIFRVLSPDNQQLQITVSQDPEGNGAGFLFIEEVAAPTKAAVPA